MTKPANTSVVPKFLYCSHRVAGYELDSFGHVNNAVFMNYLEKARGEYLLAEGLKHADFFTWNRFPLVVSAQLEFKSPAGANDNLQIKGWIKSHGAARFCMAYEITNQDSGLLVLTGETHHVFVDDCNRPCRIPNQFKERFLR